MEPARPDTSAQVQALQKENEALRAQASTADKRVAAATAVQVLPPSGSNH